MICKNLARSDLKNARLACKEFSDAAEITLFSHIYLRRNMDSFCRLRMIASTPYLAKLVRSIFYSLQMLPDWDELTNFDTWRRSHFSKGLRPFRFNVADQLLKSCPTADLHRYYSNWCGQLHSQKLMQRFDIEGRDLDDALGKLPRLDEICVGSYDEHPNPSEPVTSELFSSLGREVMVEPNHHSGVDYHVGQFTAMMAAVHKNKKNLKVIKARRLRWKTFLQHHGVLAMMIENMRQCKDFAVEVWDVDEIEDGDLQLRSIIHSAPHLRRLGLRSLPSVDLYRVFLPQSCWPNLETLQLQGFHTEEVQIKKLLAAHATSLKSLDLGDIYLKPHLSKGKIHDSSWIGMIMFLRETLNLRDVHFHSLLCNGGNETWRIEKSTVEYGRSETPMEKSLTVKNRVEKYVVEGGEFPLPWPSQTEDQSHWRDVLLAFQPRLDESWQYVANEH